MEFEEYEEEEEIMQPRQQIPRPEFASQNSALSYSSHGSYQNQESIQMKRIEQAQKRQILKSVVAEKPKKIEVTKFDSKRMKSCMENDDYDGMLREAITLVTNMSLQFSRIMNKIDANEAKIQKLERTYEEQNGRSPKRFKI